MTSQPIQLKHLLRERHWQVYRTFSSEYDKAAASIDADLIGSAPSRAQLHRWLAGELKGLPYPGHCRVLEAMFPGWTVRQMFEPWTEQRESPDALSGLVAQAIESPGTTHLGWGAVPPSVPAVHIPRQSTRVHGDGVSATEAAEAISRRLLTLGRVMRLPPAEVAQLGALAGNVVELDLHVDIDIAADGNGRVAYRRQLFNMTTAPLRRFPWELWFENPDEIVVGGLDSGHHAVTIERVHRTPSLVKYACLIEPAVEPGETVLLSYFGQGCRFVDNHYWSQTTARYTRQLTITLRHRDAGNLNSCTATAEVPDGTQFPAPEAIHWELDGNDALMTATADYLVPNQTITVRWERER